MIEPSAGTRANPLLSTDGLPSFSAILPEHIEPAVRHVLSAQRAALTRAQNVEMPGVDLLKELERIHENVHRVWSPVSHLNSVVSTPALRDAFNQCLPLITEFETEVSQNDKLYRHFVTLEKNIGTSHGTEARIVALGLRDFRLAGVGLSGSAKERFGELMLMLAARQASFEQNLMDATDAFTYHERDRGALSGLPEVVLQRARQTARDKELDGWLFTLDPPTYQVVLGHADSEQLRAHYYRAWVTRASEHGAEPERWNNGPLINEILALRHEAATLLGFDNYAELSLATKMAESTEEVIEFLRDLARRSQPVARTDLEMLADYAKRRLQPWDIAYYSEKLKQETFGLAEQDLRPYFPLPRVLNGLFEIAERLFGIQIRRSESSSPWHPTVRYFDIRRADGTPLGGLFTDLFARPNKRGGAWMDTCVNRARLDSVEQLPIAHLVCNFAPEVGETPSLLTHSDVVTLFHEFGHSLHHLLTEVDYPSLAGINGVAWDAVELPSQFLENYAWLPEVLGSIAGHYLSGEPLPEDKISTMNRSRSFLGGLAMVRQLEFALFDFLLHRASEPASGDDVLDLLARVREEVAVIEQPAYNRFANSFAHIFGGGYAAGYYSYKWAEVLAADAFAAFEEPGPFDRHTAACFRQSILAIGGSRDALSAFVDFRGRPPKLEPLLKQAGINP